ncbi:ribonuclease CL2-like [Chamaea fasciata]|uniref:ribonuclease CL2-like n=1 Tax=Chamaea fasciata TaxID=190680 RepID=UPI00336A0068
MAGWVLCMTLLLAALAGVLGETRYDKFLRQHVDYPQTSTQSALRYCNTMMARRQMTNPVCKYINTFVHAPAADLVAACSQMPNRDMTYSTTYPMSITVCRHRSRNLQPPCNYRGWQAQHYVRVNCQRGRPVHLNSTSTTP